MKIKKPDTKRVEPDEVAAALGAERVTAQQLFDKAFSGPRDPRSDEYKAGVLSCLRYRLGEQPKGRTGDLATAYPTLVQRDAFWHGCDEGMEIANRLGLPFPSHERSVVSGDSGG